MSGDAPTAHFGMKLHNLDCPDCSNEVFARAVDLFTDGESEHCRGCGSLVTISTDAESPVDVRVDEHGGDVVVRLRAEVGRLTMQLRVEGAVRARSASDGRVVAKMGIRNREMMAEVGEYLSTIAGLEVALELATQAETDDAATIGRLTRERDDEKQLRVGIVEAFAASCPRCGFTGGDQ